MILWGAICQLLGSIPELESYSECPFLLLYFWYFLCFLLAVQEFWFHIEVFNSFRVKFCTVWQIQVCLISFFYICTFSFSSINWWRSCFLFWHICWISGGCNCLCLIFSFIFCFINLNVFSCHTMLSLLLWIYNIWNLVWQFLHYYSNHTLTPWISFI